MKKDGEKMSPEEAAKYIKQCAMSVQKTTVVGTKIMSVVAKLTNTTSESTSDSKYNEQSKLYNKFYNEKV